MASGNINKHNTGCGSAWLERLVWDQEVAGSNPVTPMVKPLIFQGFLFMRSPRRSVLH